MSQSKFVRKEVKRATIDQLRMWEGQFMNAVATEKNALKRSSYAEQLRIVRGEMHNRAAQVAIDLQ